MLRGGTLLENVFSTIVESDTARRLHIGGSYG
jgi:hypothetical protein